jgi:hypothetical protein
MRFGALLVSCLAVFPAFSQVAGGAARMNYFEGEVTLDGQKLERNDGVPVASGIILRTLSGRAELLLAPDVYLRAGEQSSLRIVRDNPGGIEVELMAGSMVVDSTRSSGAVVIAIDIRDSATRTRAPGEYRFDAEPPQLRIYRGEAEVSLGGLKTVVNAYQTYALGGALPGQTAPPHDVVLDIWSSNRRIRVNTVFASGSPPQGAPRLEQPTAPSDADLASGTSSTVGLLPLTGIQELMHIPTRPYRVGSGFYGPASGFGLPSPLRGPGVQHMPHGPQVPNLPHFPVVTGH